MREVADIRFSGDDVHAIGGMLLQLLTLKDDKSQVPNANALPALVMLGTEMLFANVDSRMEEEERVLRINMTCTQALQSFGAPSLLYSLFVLAALSKYADVLAFNLVTKIDSTYKGDQARAIYLQARGQMETVAIQEDREG